MLEAVVAGAVAGYAIAIPVGAIAILILHTGIRHGLRHALAAGAGAATADGVYAVVAVMLGIAAAGIVAPLEVPLRFAAGVLLVGLAVIGLLRLRSPRDEAADPSRGVAVERSEFRTYASLLGLTLLNPMTVAYFAALVVGLPVLSGVPERVGFAGAAFAASLSWQTLLAVAGALLGRGAGRRLRTPSVVLGNLIILGFGVTFLVDVLA